MTSLTSPLSPVSSSPPALMFNSGMFSPPASEGGAPPPGPAPSSSPPRPPAGVSPPMFSSYSSASFPPFFARPTYSSTTAFHPTNTTSQSFQKFDPNIPKYEGSFPPHYEQKFSSLQPYESARMSKFEPKYEPNLSTEPSQLSQQTRSGQTSENIMVQNGQCGPLP